MWFDYDSHHSHSFSSCGMSYHFLKTPEACQRNRKVVEKALKCSKYHTNYLRICKQVETESQKRGYIFGKSEKYWWKEFLSSFILLYIQIVKQGYLNFFLCMEKHRGSLLDISILIWKSIVYQGICGKAILWKCVIYFELTFNVLCKNEWESNSSSFWITLTSTLTFMLWNCTFCLWLIHILPLSLSVAVINVRIIPIDEDDGTATFTFQ